MKEACNRAPPKQDVEREQDQAMKAAPPRQEQDVEALRSSSSRTGRGSEGSPSLNPSQAGTGCEGGSSSDPSKERTGSGTGSSDDGRSEARSRSNQELKHRACDTVCAVGKRLREGRNAADSPLEEESPALKPRMAIAAPSPFAAPPPLQPGVRSSLQHARDTPTELSTHLLLLGPWGWIILSYCVVCGRTNV
ncbi:hypothetical protein CRENBAI_012424 [Crenichthys baileyi]|uniref:Uncharacterized protein n=1 Tax=Crenichthys baileyi TaxID=28760 RepID=A0AAV9RCU1_9TELE